MHGSFQQKAKPAGRRRLCLSRGCLVQVVLVRLEVPACVSDDVYSPKHLKRSGNQSNQLNAVHQKILISESRKPHDVVTNHRHDKKNPVELEQHEPDFLVPVACREVIGMPVYRFVDEFSHDLPDNVQNERHPENQRKHEKVRPCKSQKSKPFRHWIPPLFFCFSFRFRRKVPREAQALTPGILASRHFVELG